MKKNRIAMSLLAGAAILLSACAREENFENEDVSFETDEVVFRIGEVKTRSEAENQLIINELGSVTTDDGSTFVLQETVTSLDDVSNAPETRGTPAFTENVKAVYGTFYTAALKAKTEGEYEGLLSEFLSKVVANYSTDDLSLNLLLLEDSDTDKMSEEYVKYLLDDITSSKQIIRKSQYCYYSRRWRT